ncbi:MAG TPA: hypothetical protein VLJ60_05650, partial [bacterium]|nr:hypothetical protein [bacterium]
MHKKFFNIYCLVIVFSISCNGINEKKPVVDSLYGKLIKKTEKLVEDKSPYKISDLDTLEIYKNYTLRQFYKEKCLKTID